MATSRLLPRLALLAAALVWGTSFVVVQKALVDLPVFHLLACRFALATLLLLPFARVGARGGTSRGGRWNREILRDGLVIGLLLFAGFVLQTSGLLWTTPSRSAFLTALSVLLVPLIGLALGRPLRPGPAAGSLCAMIGLYILYRPAAGAGSPPFGLGDALTVACAVVFAFYVLAVERAVRRHSLRSLAVLQFGVVAALSLPSFLIDPPEAAEFTPYSLLAIVIMGAFATAGAFFCQLYGQRHLTAVETGVILTLEPVLAAAFSVWMGVESWTSSLTIGGSLVLAAMLLAELGGSGEAPAPPAEATPLS